jgi:hypothetical protein
MRWITLPGLVVLLGIVWGQEAVAEAEDRPDISVRILDYANIPTAAVARAQQVASDLFRRIGVCLTWKQTLRPAQPSDGIAEPIDVNERFVNVLTSSMTARLPAPPGALGTAAVTPNEGGRVAYVFFERLLQSARQAQSHAMDVMGLVIAHELAHLLLPAGSHVQRGLMRAAWSLEDLGHIGHQSRFEFTPTHAGLIYERLAHQPLRSLD